MIIDSNTNIFLYLSLFLVWRVNYETGLEIFDPAVIAKALVFGLQPRERPEAPGTEILS